MLNEIIFLTKSFIGLRFQTPLDMVLDHFNNINMTALFTEKNKNIPYQMSPYCPVDIALWKSKCIPLKVFF